MQDAILSTVLQVGLVLVIAGIVYGIWGRKTGSFARYLGLYRPTLLSAFLALLFGIMSVWVMLRFPGFHEVATSEASVIGRTMAKFGRENALVVLVVFALFKTSFAEELFFRGLIGKRLMSRFGFHAGNLIQASLFGAVHFLILLAPETQDRPEIAAAIIVFTGVSGWVSGWLNERLASGSIMPGWIAHGVANLMSYIGLGYGYL
jgi:membrane protease YdiL (CAAX protease family)